MFGVRSPKLEFNSYQHEMLEGLIFSDAYIAPSPLYGFKIFQAERRLEYIEYIKQELKIDTKISYRANHRTYGTQKTNIAFKEYRERWYPKEKKIIPKDFKLTPTSCTHLYLGDGHYNKQSGHIILCTHSFSKESVEEVFLPQLHKLNIEAWMQNHSKTYWVVYIPRRSVSTFLEYIGPCPVKCFEYKWGLR